MTQSQLDLAGAAAAPDSLVWKPIKVGDLHLPHRLAMAPMTRDRSRPDAVPTPMNAAYYAQRASLALMISEGTLSRRRTGRATWLTPGDGMRRPSPPASHPMSSVGTLRGRRCNPYGRWPGYRSGR